MLRISKISFPGLGIGEFEVNSEAFNIFGISIAWYAVIITLGMIAAVAYTIFRARKIGITIDDVIDYALFTIPIGIIGARLYYVVTNLDQYHGFLDIINIRNGGLAIYGGIIFGAIAVIGVSYFKKINFLAMADCCTPGIILAQAIGRWGNFTNGEAFGMSPTLLESQQGTIEQTDIFCRMGLNNALTGNQLTFVHPTFLYESLWNILGFVLINIFFKHKKYDGQIFILVFGWYALGRAIIEPFRTDSMFLFGIKSNFILPIIIFILAASALVYFHIKKPNKPLFIKTTKTK